MKILSPFTWAFFLAFFLAPLPDAAANIGQDYGFGARMGALAGAGAAADGFGGYAAYANPAGLAFDGDQRLLVHFSIMDMTPFFTSINNVIVENTYVSDKDTVGNVAEDYRSTLGQAIGLTYRLFPDAMNFSFGLTAFLPLAQTAYIDTGESFVPEYVLYRARTQRPQVEVGFGAQISEKVRLGVGMHMGFGLTGGGNVFLQTDASKPSTMRFSSSIKVKLAPTLGVIYSTSKNSTAMHLGAVLRLPVASDAALFFKSGARAFGSFAALDFNFNALSSLYYDPLTLELGTSFQETTWGRGFFQLEYQAWGRFQSPDLLIIDPKNESCGSAPCGVNISGGKRPSVEYRDIVVPRIGQEIRIGRVTWRLGYAFRRGIIKNVPTEAGNFLDPDKHIFTLGAGIDFRHFLAFNVPCTVDFNLAWHKLVGFHVTKSAGDENNNVTDSKIGSPGYDAGGNLFGGGVTLGLAF